MRSERNEKKIMKKIIFGPFSQEFFFLETQIHRRTIKFYFEPTQSSFCLFFLRFFSTFFCTEYLLSRSRSCPKIVFTVNTDDQFRGKRNLGTFALCSLFRSLFRLQLSKTDLKLQLK